MIIRKRLLIPIFGTILGIWLTSQLVARFFNLRDNIRYTDGEVLILSMEASGAHLSSAKAIKSKLQNYNIKCDIVLADYYCDPTSVIGSFYETATRTSLGRIALNQVFAPGYWMTTPIITRPFSLTISHLLKDSRYKCVVSVIPFNFNIKSNVPFIIIPTDMVDPKEQFILDYMPGYWFNRTTLNAYYLLASERIRAQAIQVGISPDRIRKISGLIVNEAFTSQTKTKAQLRQALRIEKDAKVVLFLFGSCGSTEMVDLMNIMDQHPQYHCIFVCGKAKELKARLDGLNVNGKHQVLGFVTNVAELMTASDVVVGKPGGTVTAESIACKVPIVMRSGIDVMLQERYNVDYIKELGVGEVVTDWNDLPEMLEWMFENYSEYAENFKTIPKNNALQETVEFIKEVVRG